MGAIYLRAVGQGADGFERGGHLRRRAFRQATTTRTKQGIAAKQAALAKIGQMRGGVMPGTASTADKFRNLPGRSFRHRAKAESGL